MGISREQETALASVEVVEATLPGLIDRHLRWVPQDESPSHALSAKVYGYLPTRFNQQDAGKPMRPSREPVDFRLIAGEVLGINPESPYFEDSVRDIDGFNDAIGQDPKHQITRSNGEKDDGWYSFLFSHGFDETEVVEMQRIAKEFYQLNTLTEDNLPAYVLETMGVVREFAHKWGIKTSALDEWFTGLWPGEEDAHKINMNDYGQIMRYTTSPQHVAGRNSQLRTGTAVRPQDLIEIFCYTPRQEYATKIAHENDSLLMGPAGGSLLKRISQDETRHEDLYTGVLKELVKDSRLSSVVISTLRASYEKFKMPGSDGIPQFRSHSLSFERARVFGIQEDFESAKHILKKLGLLAKDEDGTYKIKLDLDEKASEDLQWLRDNFDKEFEPPNRKSKTAFVLGKTVTKAKLREYQKGYMEHKGLHNTASV